MGQLESSLTKADSEQLARSIAEEQYSDLEKEKIMKELEIKDMMARHKQELLDKEATIGSVSVCTCTSCSASPVLQKSHLATDYLLNSDIITSLTTLC